MTRVFSCDAATRPKCSVMLREAARIALERRDPITLCDALSSILPRDEFGNMAWRDAKEMLRYCIPDDFEGPAAWWRLEDREPRVLGALIAAAIAESYGD